MADQQNSYIPAHVEAFQYSLPNLARRLTASGAVKIVAIGSSSTSGEGDIAPYPYRLEVALRTKYPGRMIDVLNRGISGEEAREELARMRQDVIAEAPALTIWQVGTNAVWQKGHDLGDVAAAIEAGLKLLAGETTDVVIVDLQYAPAVLTDDKIDATRRMLSLITEVSGAARVNVFRRFELMRTSSKSNGIRSIRSSTRPIPIGCTKVISARRIGYELGEAIATAATNVV